MAENTKNPNQERIRQITDSIENSIQSLFESGAYQRYLSTMSRFHRYSVNNQILIYMQKPDATLVAGFNAWKDKFGRHVKKGEKGIQILAPTATMKKIRETKFDPDTGAPLLDEKGNVITEEKTVRTVSNFFKPVMVFDVSQTEGKALPQLAQTLNGDVEHYDAFVEALRRASPVPIEFENMAVTTDGYFSASDQRIAIRIGMSQVQTVAALVHEIGHSKLHDYDRLQAEARADGGKEPVVKDRRTEEVEAESVAYAVCQYYGIDTGENSFGYIAAWSQDKDLKALKASLGTINKTVASLISDIDRHLAQIRKERGLDQEKGAEEAAPEPEHKETVSAQPQAETPEAPAEPPDAYLAYATALMDHAEELHQAGLIENPFLNHEKPELAKLYADTLRSGGTKHAQEVLDDYAEQSGFPTPEPLQAQLNALQALWNSGMTYDIHTSELDENVSYITSFTPTGEVDDGILFSGPTAVCEKLLRDLRDGTTTPDQARAMNRQWNHIIPPGQPEALYLVDDTAFVHLQITDAGYDYTVYDATTNVLIDGGQFSAQNAEMHRSARTMMEGALLEVCVLQGLDFVGHRECSLERLEQLREANENPPKLDEYPMPDSTVAPDALVKAGCKDADAILPVSRDRAKELYAEGYTIYVLDEHGDPLMCFDEDDLSAAGDKQLAIERYEWEKSPSFRSLVRDQRIEHQADREAAFLRYPGDAFAIYQISDKSSQRRERLFTSIDGLREEGLEPTRDHYDLIYTGAIADHPSVNDPENAFRVFNLEHPHDYAGHSLSVSDIVAFRRNGVVSYHYCDSIGFEDVPNFQKPENYLKNAEMAMEDDYNSIDGIINNGPKDQGPPQQEPKQPERPSLRERLQSRADDQEPPQRRPERQRQDERSV